MGVEKEFYLTLHEIALRASDEFSFEGDEGERSYTLVYSGSLSSNYPWIYVEFRIIGPVPLENLVELEERFRAACDKQPVWANYLSTTVSSGGVKCRLIYREDLKR